MDSDERDELLVALAQMEPEGSTGIAKALGPVVHRLALALNVARTSVWLYADSGTEFLDCVALYDGREDRVSAGARLAAARYPLYFAALADSRAIAAADAASDPRTAELHAAYLSPTGVVSMLDAPIMSGGRPIGVLCCETRATRGWTDDEEALVASAADIISRIVVGQQRAELAFQLGALLDAGSQAVLVLNHQGGIVSANAAASTMFGYAPSDLVGLPAEALAAESARAAYRAARERFFSGPQRSFPSAMPSRGRKRSGSEFPIEVTLSVIEQDGVRRALAQVSDVTLRAEAQNELAEQRELYRRVVEDQDDLIIRADRTGRVTFSNGAAQSFFGPGVEAGATTQRSLFSFVPEEDHGTILDATSAISLQSPRVRYEHRVIRHDGNALLHSWTVSAFFDAAGKIEAYQAIGRDISRERQNEARMREAQRLEALAVFSGGIAHDFNNLLTPIMTLTELALGNLESDSPDIESLRKVLQASDRARDLVRQILTFGRKNAVQGYISASPAIREAVAFIRASLPASIELIEEVDSNCGTVVASAADLYQVVSNLCTNAFQAMPGGGRMTISASMIGRAGTDATQLQIIVRDTGAGMDRSVRERIFEPFFTTKAIGEGTGLGLSVVHGIVTALGGVVDVQSEAGRGTSFVVVLPLVVSVPSVAPGGVEVTIAPVGFSWWTTSRPSPTRFGVASNGSASR